MARAPELLSPGSFRRQLAAEGIADRGAISSSLSSSAKWPVSRRWNSASGRSRNMTWRPRRENLVVLAPDDQGRRLALAKERLKFGYRARSFGVEERVELDVFVARAVEQRLVVPPIVRIDPRTSATPSVYWNLVVSGATSSIARDGRPTRLPNRP